MYACSTEFNLLLSLWDSEPWSPDFCKVEAKGLICTFYWTPKWNSDWLRGSVGLNSISKFAATPGKRGAMVRLYIKILVVRNRLVNTSNEIYSILYVGSSGYKRLKSCVSIFPLLSEIACLCKWCQTGNSGWIQSWVQHAHLHHL